MYFLRVPIALIFTLFLSTLDAFATDRPGEVKNDAAIQERLGEVLDLKIPFLDENGTSVQLSELMIQNRPSILVPVYYRCPRICPATLNSLSRMLEEIDLVLGKDFSLITYSIDASESPALALKRAEKVREGLSDRILEQGASWHFLTGTEESVKSLSQQIGFGYKPDRGEFIHAALSVVLTPEGKISRYLYGTNFPAEDIKFSLIEAAEGRIGSTIDKILLYCFRLDPTRGKYTLDILNVTKVICLSFLAILFGGILWLRFQESGIK